MDDREREGKLRVELDRGHRAETILGDQLFLDALEAVKDAAWQEFIKARPEDSDALRVARLKVDCAETVISQFRSHIRTGKLARSQLSQMAEKVKAAAKRINPRNLRHRS